MARLLTLLGITLLTFLLTHIVPADPARTVAGPKADRETIETIRREMALDAPWAEQYALYLGRLVRGDLGRSYLTRQDVRGAILQRLPATAFLALCALAVAVALGVAGGAWAALRADRAGEGAIVATSVLLLSVPVFWLGLMLLYLFGYRLRWLPLGGFDSAASVVLPALTLGLGVGAQYLRVIHANLREALRSDYVRTAVAKGAPPRVVVLRHALRNALLPFVTLLALDLAALLGGVVLTETVFNWPGLGRLAVESVVNQDVPMIMGVVLFTAALVLATNAAADLVYGWIDPRVRDATG